MIWRGPWDGRWDGAWEGQSEPLAPGFIRGAASIRITAAAGASALASIAGTATLTVGGTGTLVGPQEGFIRGTATIALGATGRLTDPNAPQTFVLQGGGGSSKPKRKPAARPKVKRRVYEEITRRPEPVRIGLTPGEIRQLVVEAVATTLQNRPVVTLPTLQKPQVVTRPPDQHVAPVGIAPEWFGLAAVVEDLTPIIEARKARRRRLLLLAAAHYYEEAA